MSETLDALKDYLILLKKDSRIGKVVLGMWWYFCNQIRGPRVTYYDKTMNPLPHKGTKGFSLETMRPIDEMLYVFYASNMIKKMDTEKNCRMVILPIVLK
jgi:hypothetical protein